MKEAVSYINTLYGTEVCSIRIRDSYRNMKEVLDQHPEAVRIARSVMEDLGLTVLNEPVRGGTDGSQITFMGLPCPNLGCGGGNFHGRYEYCVMEELEMAREVILGIVQKTAEEEL